MIRISKNYGQQIKSHRKEMRITQQQLARISGITQQEISNIERGKIPSGSAFWRLNDVLGISAFEALTPKLELDDYDVELIENYLQSLRDDYDG